MADSHNASVHPVRSIFWWVLLVLAVLCAAAYWFFWRAPSSPPPASVAFSPSGMPAMRVPVRLVRATMEPITQVFDAVGTVTAHQTVTVRSRVDGLLEAIHFSDGQRVQAGDVLALVDPRPFQVRLDQTRGQLQQVRAQLDNARQDLKRFQTLFKQNSLARQQLDAQVALVAQLEGQVLAAQAAVDEAALDLSFTEITAPVEGLLGIRLVDAGNMIRTSDAEGLVVLTRTQPIAVMFSLPQAQLPPVQQQLQAGGQLHVELYGKDDTQWLAVGSLVAVDNQIDVATGTVRLKAEVANEDERLFPNQFVNVRLKVAQQEQLVIPVNAVQYGSIGTFVYRVDDKDTVQIQTVQTGWVQDQRIAIVQGLSAGDRVVVEGADRLRNGAKVRVIEEASDATGPSPGGSTVPAGASRAH